MTVAVVGGGIIGASIGWRLVQRGARVTVFDARTLGGEASWAAAGMLAPGGELESNEGWRGAAIESARTYGEFVRELESESGLEIDYRRSGALEVAREEDEVSALAAKAQRQASAGIPSEPVAISHAAAIAPAASLEGFAAARYYAGDGQVNPRDIMAALRRALEAHGAAIRENEPKRQARTVNGHVELDGQGFDAAVIAAGAWAGEIDTGAPMTASFPVRGHLAGYWLQPGLLGPLLRRGHTYLLQRNSGFLIAGASEERVGYRRETDPEAASGIQSRAAALLPALRGRPADEVWTGFRPAVAGYEPRVGRINAESPVWLAYGHYRNGILMAPATAREIAADLSASLGIG